MRQWGAVGQHDMAPNAERRMCKRNRDRFIERGPGRHQCRGGQRSRFVQLCHSTVDTACQAEVVSVRYQTAHSASLTAFLVRVVLEGVSIAPARALPYTETSGRIAQLVRAPA